MPFSLGFHVADVRPHSVARSRHWARSVEQDSLGSLLLHLSSPRPVVLAAVSVSVDIGSPLTCGSRLPDA